MVGIAAHQRRQVEGHAQAGAARRNQLLVALVGLLRRPEPGELAHGPELAAVAGRVNAADVGKLTRVVGVVEAFEIVGGIEALDQAAGNGRERTLALGRLAQGRLDHFAFPALLLGACRVGHAFHIAPNYKTARRFRSLSGCNSVSRASGVGRSQVPILKATSSVTGLWPSPFALNSNKNWPVE